MGGGAKGEAIYDGSHLQLQPFMKAFTFIGHRLLMEPLTREQGPASQSIKLSALMVVAMVYVIIRLTGPLRMHLKFVEQSKNRRAGGILALSLALTMPRARGRPRRGVDWYAVGCKKEEAQEI
jgi:hypothetical protein